MWTHQNRFKHGSTGPDQQQLKERLQEEIEEEYDQGTDDLLPRNHHWLEEPLADMLSKSTTVAIIYRYRTRPLPQPTNCAPLS